MNSRTTLFLNQKHSAVDLIPFAYVWRKDRKAQESPEADFLPRRIRRQDEVYRTALSTLGPDEVKSPHYQQRDLLKEQLPPAKGELTTGALWVGGITDYTVTLVWPDDCTPPLPEEVEVRVYPTAWGWFGFSVDRLLTGPAVSNNGRVWQYGLPEDQEMDWAYSRQVKAATETVAVFAPTGSAVPELHVTGDSLGKWEELTFTVSWGIDDALPEFDGFTKTYMAHIISETVDRENKTATYTCLYSNVSRYGNDSKFTVILDENDGLGATVLLRDLAKEPIYVPEAGLYFCPAHASMTLQEYLSSQKGEQIRTKVRNHKEVTDWEELIQAVRLWRCPDGTEIVDFPDAPAASAVFRVPDKRWETMYDLAVEQLRGPNMWGMLSSEVSRATLAMELVGLTAEADRIYDYFLPSPGIKSDGDFSTGAGSLEWAKSMRHDMGYNHEGTHSSSGKLMFAMLHRYTVSHDTAWLQERLPRLKQAMDWLIGESEGYMKDTSNREQLHCYGLMPPEMLGDYALPACDWRWYYHNNAYTQMALTTFAEVLTREGDPDSAHYTKKAEEFSARLLSAVKREGLYAPVRKGRDGLSRSFLPRMAYAGGLLHFGEETNIPQFAMGISDLFQGALALGEKNGLLPAEHRLMVGTVDAMEEGGMNVSVAELEKLDHPTADAQGKELEQALQAESANQKRTAKAPVAADDLWFYNTFSNLPKISHNANLYLQQDDIENFLHFFFHHAIVMVGTNGKLWEHAHPDMFVECKDPDNGTAAWFVENFRNMLVTEEGDTLWLMKGTPRDWLKAGKTVEAQAVPTMYGKLTYRVTAGENGVITATIQVPERQIPPVLKLRLRHPEKATIRQVTVNGQKMDCVEADGETLRFTAPVGRFELEVRY